MLQDFDCKEFVLHPLQINNVGKIPKYPTKTLEFTRQYQQVVIMFGKVRRKMGICYIAIL